MEQLRDELPELDARLNRADTAEEVAAIHRLVCEIELRAHDLRELAATAERNLKNELALRVGGDFVRLLEVAPDQAFGLIDARLAELEARP